MGLFARVLGIDWGINEKRRARVKWIVLYLLYCILVWKGLNALSAFTGLCP